MFSFVASAIVAGDWQHCQAYDDDSTTGTKAREIRATTQLRVRDSPTRDNKKRKTTLRPVDESCVPEGLPSPGARHAGRLHARINPGNVQ